MWSRRRWPAAATRSRAIPWPLRCSAVATVSIPPTIPWCGSRQRGYGGRWQPTTRARVMTIPVVIDIPKGGYVPDFRRSNGRQRQSAAVHAGGNRRRWLSPIRNCRIVRRPNCQTQRAALVVLASLLVDGTGGRHLLARHRHGHDAPAAEYEGRTLAAGAADHCGATLRGRPSAPSATPCWAAASRLKSAAR